MGVQDACAIVRKKKQERHEAEYRAIASTTAKVNWLTHLLHELGFPLPSPPTFCCDNVGAIYLCSNPVFHSRMKHVAIDFHFVHDQVAKKLLHVSRMLMICPRPIVLWPYCDFVIFTSL